MFFTIFISRAVISPGQWSGKQSRAIELSSHSARVEWAQFISLKTSLSAGALP